MSVAAVSVAAGNAAATAGRRAIALWAVGIGLCATAGCTASRSVDEWREGWAAEARGDVKLAERRYAAVNSRMGNYPGARLNQIRLLAAVPERRADAQELLDKLLKSEAADRRVAAFAALWALAQGQPAQARARLGAATAEPNGDPQVEAAFAEAEIAVLMAEKQWQVAWQRVQQRTPTTARAHLQFAILAWNVGEFARAEAWLTAAPAGRETSLLRALLLAKHHNWGAVLAALAPLEGEAVTPLVLTLRAQAALYTQPPDVAAALRDAAEAARRDPANPAATEVWACAQLQADQPQLARDLLAGLTARGGGWTTWFNLGLAHLRLGELVAAAQTFQAAAQRCPGCAVAVKNRDALRDLGVM